MKQEKSKLLMLLFVIVLLLTVKCFNNSIISKLDENQIKEKISTNNSNLEGKNNDYHKSSFIDVSDYYQDEENQENKKTSDKEDSDSELVDIENEFLEKAVNKFKEEKKIKKTNNLIDNLSNNDSMHKLRSTIKKREITKNGLFRTSSSTESKATVDSMNTNSAATQTVTNQLPCAIFNNCNNNGKCVDGKCQCKEGWSNYDCSISK